MAEIDLKFLNMDRKTARSLGNKINMKKKPAKKAVKKTQKKK